MTRLRASALSALMLLAAWTGAAGCASTGRDDGVTQTALEDGVVVAVSGEADASELADFASRELAAFRRRGRHAADLADAAYAMERGLRQQGRAHAQVDLGVEYFAKDPGRVKTARIDVKPGPVVRLEQLHFPGASADRVETLSAQFRKDSGLLSAGPPLFRFADLDAAVGRIESLYLLDGHHAVRVGPPRVMWTEGGVGAIVDVPVVEGPRATVGKVRLDGELDPELKQSILAGIGVVGAPYHARLAAETAARARRVLLDRGHRYATVEADAELPEEGGAAVLTLHVNPGPVLRMRKLEIRGTERTRKAFIRGLVPLEEGDIVTQAALDEGLSALYASGVFRTIEVSDTGVPGAEPEVFGDVILQLEELPARSTELEAGWGSYELLRGSVTYRDRNLAGTGRELIVSLSGSVRSVGLEGHVLDRFLLGPSYLVQVDSRYDVRQEPTFRSQAAEFQASARHDASDHRFWRVGYRLRVADARSIDGSVRGAEQGGFERSAGVFATVGRDTRDDKLFPTRGMAAELGLFRSAPVFGADLDFLETKAQYATYIALREGTVLALGGRFITRDVLDDRPTLPVQERLFLGGESSVRSFRESLLGPRDRSGDPTGGLTSLDAHVELRQRLIGDLDGALFYDVGNVARRSFSLSDHSGQAIGAGLRYRLPVGPVRLDFGYNPGNRFAESRGWAVQLSFGFSF